MKEIRFSAEDASGTVTEAEITRKAEENAPLLETVKSREERFSDSLGWLFVDEWAGEEWLARYEEAAEKVRARAEVLVVIGIGGSNQAARAVYEALPAHTGTDLIWAGNTISPRGLSEAMEAIGERDVCIDVIAKNFETLEPGIAFRAFRDYLRGRYGSDYASRVICTGTKGSRLWDLCEENGYTFLPFPDDIGGRYTALSPVGLFPLAAAGADIRAMAAGAAHMQKRLFTEPAGENIALRYASLRALLHEKGLRIELLAFFEPALFRFGRWWVQLFGESEGKDGKGLFPAIGNFSEDLHSIGQYIQAGTRQIFETFLDPEQAQGSYILKGDLEDGFHYLDGRDFADINRAAFEATFTAHSRRFPCAHLEVPALDEETFGQLFYFFQFACYLSAELLGVNPFDQPGVEAYKNDMFRRLGKDGTSGDAKSGET